MPYQFYQHAEYAEVRLQGVIETFLALKPEELSEVGQSGRLLLDYGDVTEVRADPYVLAEQAKRIESAGLKVAVYAPRPALYGISRQVFQLGLIHEGISASVFQDLEEARAWLLAG